MKIKEETDLMHRIMFALSQDGHLVFRANVGLFYTINGYPIRIGTPGHSDLYGVTKKGRAYFCEVKRPNCKRSDQQIRFCDAINATGALAFVATSVDEAVAIINNYESSFKSESSIQLTHEVKLS